MRRELLVLLIVLPVVVAIHAIALYLANRNVTADMVQGKRRLLVNRVFTVWHAVAFAAVILAAIFLRDSEWRLWVFVPLSAHLLAAVAVWSAVVAKIRRPDPRQPRSQPGGERR